MNIIDIILIETNILMLAHINTHHRDNLITFDEPTHIYTIKNDPAAYTSCTTFNAQHFQGFNADEVIKKMMQSARWTSSPYFGMSVDEIKKKWKDSGVVASTLGTALHYYIECYYNKSGCSWDLREKLLVNDPTSLDHFEQFVAANKHLVPYRTEWMIYNEDLKIAGSIDAVFVNEDGTYSIYDWKRSKEIKKTAFGGAWAKTECISHIPDSNYWKYALQLNVYKAILEEKYGITVSELCLVVLHPDNKSFIKMTMPVLKEEINALFKWRLEQLV